MSEWQPIETAPKDGTWVLVSPGASEPVSIGKFTGARGQQWHAGAWREFSGWVDLESDCGMEYGDCSSDQLNIWPTHWMPLPNPPTKEPTP